MFSIFFLSQLTSLSQLHSYHLPSQVAWEKLGLSRATRLERLRVAAEVGDARRLSALLEAGVDVDAVNEPWLHCRCFSLTFDDFWKCHKMS